MLYTCRDDLIFIYIVQIITYIVKATNTGGDVGVGQFDLLMPGGGVGLFNGCQPQWGAPADGWGDRYGGVQNRDGCYQLPAQLQPGCYFLILFKY